ncbi:hypothetical protein INR49_028935 [Caranx melampygus]|nr:hypothetical protein INR49_028935 [Caranx melampygus]
MEGNLQGGGSDLATMHVKTEAVDENSSALVLGSQEPPACRGGGGGGDQAAGELADTELQAATTTTPVLLYPVSTDRFFTTSGDGKTYLKIAPASAMPPAPSEKMLPAGSDFSSKAVLCLIEAVGRRWGLYETRERSQLFQSVQEEMASKGHILPLMDATLSDTVGTQIINNKRIKGGSSVSSLPCPLAKIAVKPQLQPPTTIIRPNSDFATSGGLEPVGEGPTTSQIISSTSAMTTVTTATISPTNTPEVKPLIVLNGDIVTTSIHPATIVPSPSFISSPCFTETASTSPSLGSASNTDHNVSCFVSRKAPSFSSAVIPFRLSTATGSNSHKILGLSPSFSPPSPCLTSAATSLSGKTVSGTEGPNQKGNEEQGNTVLFQEILKRQEEQGYLDRVARRRVEAREKRRERREVRMAESLGRIATALELLSSKQDTVIALLQRLADRK